MHALPLMQVRLTLRSAPNMYATFLIIFENFFPSSTFFHLHKQKPSPISTFFDLPIFHLKLKSVPHTSLLGPTRSLIRNLRVYNLIVYDAKDDRLLGRYISVTCRRPSFQSVTPEDHLHAALICYVYPQWGKTIFVGTFL